MILNYKLKVFLIAFVFGLFTNVCNANPQTDLKINATYFSNWELVKEEQGIQVYIAQYETIDQTMAYKIKFENTTNKEANLTWSLVNKDSQTIFSEKNTIVKANDFAIIVDQKNPISVRFSEKSSDFQIKLNIQ